MAKNAVRPPSGPATRHCPGYRTRQEAGGFTEDGQQMAIPSTTADTTRRGGEAPAAVELCPRHYAPSGTSPRRSGRQKRGLKTIPYPCHRATQLGDRRVGQINV